MDTGEGPPPFLPGGGRGNRGEWLIITIYGHRGRATFLPSFQVEGEGIVVNGSLLLYMDTGEGPPRPCVPLDCFVPWEVLRWAEMQRDLQGDYDD